MRMRSLDPLTSLQALKGHSRRLRRAGVAFPCQYPLFSAFVFSACAVAGVRSEFVGAAIIPHGDFAYDPTLLPEHSTERERADAIHAASVEAGKYIDELRPDIIFLCTPHGVALDRDFALFLNSKASGYALIGGDLIHHNKPLYKVPLSFGMDPALAGDLCRHLKRGDGAKERNVSCVSSFADSEPQAVRWGEVVPLSFLSNATLASAKVVLLSHPTRRYTEQEQMVPELLELGAALFSFFQQEASGRVAVIASSDLAHTHLAAGPYGFSPAAAPFDRAVGRWAADPRGAEWRLVEEAVGLGGKALSCGLPSLLLLHALLLLAPGMRPHLLANAHPTYYGMLVATF